MKRTNLIAVLVGLAALAAVSQDAFARGRMYHPGLGVFMQRDPVGTPLEPLMARNLSGAQYTQRDPTEQYADGMNLYRYVQNNPVNGLDPSGLKLIRTEKPQSIKIAFGKGELKGTLFQSLHCCPKGTKNAGQNRYVSEIKASGSYSDSKAYTPSDLPGWAGKVGWVLGKLGQEAEVGVKWKVSGTLQARYDDCTEKVTLANGSISASATPYGHVDLGGSVNPKQQIQPLIGDLWGTVEWPDREVTVSLKGDVEGTAIGTGNAEIQGKTLILRGNLSVSGALSGSYNLWDWQKGSFGPVSGNLSVVNNQEFARYTFK